MEKINPNKNIDQRSLIDDVLEDHGLITKEQKIAKQAERLAKKGK